MLLTPYFLLYKGEQEARRRAVTCPVSGGIIARVSNPQAVPTPPPPPQGHRLRGGDKPTWVPSPRAPGGSRGGSTRPPPPARAPCSRERHLLAAPAGHVAGALTPRVPAPAPHAGCPAPRSGRAGRAASAELGKRPGEEEEPGAPSGWSREPENGGGGFPGPGLVGLLWRLGRVTGIPMRPPWATS